MPTSFEPAQTIDDVIQQLEDIIQWSLEHQSRLGYFPVLYQSVTKAVKTGIAENRFSDGARMEKLDVIFANRYLEAFHQYQSRKKPSKVWAVAFDSARKSYLPVLNHLLLGINAHINLDLGIAAAETIAGPNVEPLKGDFDEINRLLFEMINGVQDKLGELSPLARWSDWFFRNWDERLAKFSLKKARENAWRVAQEFAQVPKSDQNAYIQQEDQRMLVFAMLLKGVGFHSRIFYKLVQLFEKKRHPADIIGVLRDVTREKGKWIFLAH
ncbi:MAG: DUF5995 family protein [Bacteroidota bacterium]